MANLFQEVLSDAQGVEERLLGPTYKYYNQIKMPSEIGMSSDGNLGALARDINGLVQYVEVLVTGNSNASKTGRPLGNKFFLQTGAKCMAPNNQEVDRYIYVNNVPAGNIPFISNGLGVNFSEFKGLIPGTMSDLNVLNPFAIMQSFMSGSTPPCQEVTLQTIDVNNNVSQETHYVTLVDLQNMDPCTLPGNVNNYANPAKSCRETFENRLLTPANVDFPKDPIVQVYFAGLAALGIYTLSKLMDR
jgi:hypothetical protein